MIGILAMRRLPIFVILAVLLLAACGPSPKAKANKYAERMPRAIGEFRQDNTRVELTAEAVGNTGHVTLSYSQRETGAVYVVIDVYGTKSAADVAVARRERDLRLLGYTFEADRQPRALTAQVAELPQGRIAVLQNDEVVIEIEYIRHADAEFNEASWQAFLDTVREVDRNVGR
jgi:hypothetical protein